MGEIKFGVFGQTAGGPLLTGMIFND